MEIHYVHDSRISADLTHQGATQDMFRIYAATDDAWTFTVRDDAGAVVAIQSWAMRMNLYNDRDKGTLIKSWTSSAGIDVTTDGSNGNAALTIDDSDVTGANNRDYPHAVLELVGYTGGSLAGEPDRRLQINAEVLKSLYIP